MKEKKMVQLSIFGGNKKQLQWRLMKDLAMKVDFRSIFKKKGTRRNQEELYWDQSHISIFLLFFLPYDLVAWTNTSRPAPSLFQIIKSYKKQWSHHIKEEDYMESEDDLQEDNHAKTWGNSIWLVSSISILDTNGIVGWSGPRLTLHVLVHETCSTKQKVVGRVSCLSHYSEYPIYSDLLIISWPPYRRTWRKQDKDRWDQF